MSVNAWLTFFDKADGESVQKGRENWIDVLTWNWAVDAESSWTKGGGASVGKPNPDKLIWEHVFDTSSHVLLGYICTGKAFPKAQLQMARPIASGAAEAYFTMTLEGVFVTGVAIASRDDGSLVQRVEMVFKTVRIEYQPQDRRTGRMGPATIFTWDIPAGTASPSA